jgi:hypothetical protein
VDLLIPHPQISPPQGVLSQQRNDCRSEVLIEFEEAKQVASRRQ